MPNVNIDLYWEWPLEGTGNARVCKACNERVFFDEPDATFDPRTKVGHDPDCLALQVWTEGLAASPPLFTETPSGGGGTGGAGTPITLARSDIDLSRSDVTLETLAA